VTCIYMNYDTCYFYLFSVYATIV